MLILADSISNFQQNDIRGRFFELLCPLLRYRLYWLSRFLVAAKGLHWAFYPSAPILFSLQSTPLNGAYRLLLKDVRDNNECLEALVLGLTVVETVVNLLHNDGKAE